MAENGRPGRAGKGDLGAFVLGVILVVSALVVAVSPLAQATITGTPTLAYSSSETSAATLHHGFNDVNSSIGVVAGTASVVNADSSAVTPPKYFTVDTTGVTFSGSSIYLYVSTNGNAEIGNAEGDIYYAGPFPALRVSSSASTTPSAYTAGGTPDSSGPYYLAANRIIGPIPTLVNASYQYVKLYDGSCGSPSNASGFTCAGTGVAGAKQSLLAAPGISISPGSGSAGTRVTLEGGGFVPGAKIVIAAQYSAAPWTGSNSSHMVLWIMGIEAKGGIFSAIASMVDAKQVINPKTTGPFTTVPIVLSAVEASNTAKVLNPAQEALNPPTFREFSRGIASVLSYDASGKAVDITDGAFTSGSLYGNDSGTTGTVGAITVRDLPTVNVEPCGTLKVTGNFSYVGGSVTFYVESTPGTFEPMNTTSAVTAGPTGSWTASILVPELSGGSHSMLIENSGVNYGVFDPNAVSTTTSCGTTTTSTTSSSSSTAAGISSSSTTTLSSSEATSSSLSSSTTSNPMTSSSQSPSTSSSTPTTSATTTTSGSTTSNPSTTGSGIPEFTYGGLAVLVMVVAVVVGYVVVRERLNS